MEIDVIRTRERRSERSEDAGERAESPSADGGVVDVSGVSAADLQGVARGADPDADVHLEHRGGRTYLVAE